LGGKEKLVIDAMDAGLDSVPVMFIENGDKWAAVS
jgi:hypothetical protein